MTLHNCVRSWDLDELNRLLDDGWPVDGRNKNEWSPLCLGAELGCTEIVKVLISHGADLNVKDALGLTPLHNSAMRGRKETVKVLIQHGADADAVDQWGRTPLWWAEDRGNIDTAYILRLAKPIQAVHRKLLSFTHDVSARGSRSEKVKCSTPVTPKDTSVNMADTVRKLTLHDCVKQGDLDKLTRALNDECPVDERDEDGWAPLCIGAWLGHTEIVKVLISRGADVNVKDKYGWTPLDYMAYQGNREIVEVLISHGADVNVKDIYGETPLSKGVFEGHKEVVEVLISHGADVNVKDINGDFLLHRSARQGYKEIVKVLLINRADVNVKDKCGEALLNKSAQSGDKEIVKLLIQHGADVNVKDKNGETLLNKSAESGATETVKLLIQHGADVNVKGTFDEKTPLHRSARSGDTEIVKLLIQHGADIDAVDRWGNTPLMLAKLYGHRDIVDIIKQIKSPVRKIKKVVAGFFGYSSRTRKVTVQRTDEKGQMTEVKYESSEVRKQVAKSCETFESLSEGKEDKLKEHKGSQGQTMQELVTNSAETSSYLNTSEVDVCTSPELSAQLSTSPLQSLATTSPSPSPPLSSPTPRPQRPPTPQSSQQRRPQPRKKITRLAQEMLKAVNEGKSDEEVDGVGQYQDSLNVPSDNLDGNVIVIQQRTENHYHYPKCDCNNKQSRSTSEEVRVETSETLDVSVGSTKYGIMHSPQGVDHATEDEDEYIYRTKEDREKEEEERSGQILDTDLTDKSCAGLLAQAAALSSSPLTTTTSSASRNTKTSAAELRRRLESQAGYMEKMVQSCVAGGGVCQDQSSDLVPLLHGGLQVPVNFNFIMQPKHVEVWSARQMNVEKADVENAEMMPVNSTCNFNYAAKKSSDDEDNEDNTDDDNSEDDKDLHIENDEDVLDGDQ